MSQREVNAIAGRLSLRAPQTESLAKLASAIEAAPAMLKHDREASEVVAVLNALKGQFPTLQDFERDFPSLCFALATGVGKTRLMGAFISYLYQAHGIKHFFVLAPNLTIYDKLIADFTPNTPKYVFRGVAEFASYPPEIITGDNYEERAQALGDLLSPVTINIFNIAKITSEVRGGKSPRIKRLSEYIGQSYFDYLAGLPDLVLLMDESHRYRATAGLRAINELKPLIGLELTATPFTETTKGPVQFLNVVMDYPLARAMEDGFVKEPAVVTQRNFDAGSMPPEEVERVKLQDGVRMHEATKVELKTYARNNSANGVKEVKPFMLVIARDTTHAGALLAWLQSDGFFGGRYRHKVIQVDSSKSGAEEEEMVRRLLAVESVDEPTEIVIHVNMLKEGWDVTNLYTIVPLRAANARTLVEQSIGRGLRLPYGKRTKNAAVDRLNIIAHDRFQDIIDDANRADSPIKLKILILDAPYAGDDRMQSRTIQPNFAQALGLGQSDTVPEVTDADAAQAADSGVQVPTPIFTTPQERQAAHVVMEVMAEYELRTTDAPTRQAFLTPALQARIAETVQERLPPVQLSVLTGTDAPPPLDLADVVRRTVDVVVKQTIDIPRIAVVPQGVITSGFKPFTLDVKGLHLQPKDRSLVGQTLRTHEQFTYTAQAGRAERRLEDYIVHALIDYDDIDYMVHASLLYDLAGQIVAHLQSYLTEADEVRNVLDLDRQLIAKNIHAQMMEHFYESATEYAVEVRRGFTTLKEPTYTVGAGQPLRDYRDTVDEPSRIKQMVFGHFSRCLYPQQKFDSDTERRFAVILERDSDKWFKPAKGQFQLFYKLGVEQPEYVPDFVVETAHHLLMCETKARNELGADDVKAKAEAGALWCKHASDHAKKIGSKPWKYLLIAHDVVTEDKTLVDFLSFEEKGRGHG